MQTTVPTSQRVKALAAQATEFKQHSDNCSGQSETWSELNLDKFVQMLVEECVGKIEEHCLEVDQRSINLNSLKSALRAHFETQ
ncbi:hypothetical protein [Variovorax paradoxus]|jgi:hypothetical protein|uniref:hypothetical protein n=1 Tax=Variovorax paradoxus TaxID=34073 RepID=UPI00070A7035